MNWKKLFKIKRKTYPELIEQIKQRMRESGLVKKYIYFIIISGFYSFGLFALFLFYVLTMKLDFLISLALVIIISFVFIFLALVCFFLYRNPRAKRNWIITPIWNFLDGKHLKYGIITRIIGEIFAVIFAIFIFFLYINGAFQNVNEKLALLVAILLITSALIFGVIDIVFLLKRYREVKNLK